jgi:hypothetical protein
MDGRIYGLRTFLVTCCLVLAGCSSVSANQSAFEKNERDFYRARASDSHYLFLSTLEFFENQRNYESAIAKSAEILSGKEQWILVEKLVPALGDFQIGIIYRSQSDKPWRASVIYSNMSGLAEVDVKSAAARIDKLWDGAPTSDVASDALSMSDPVVYYISVGKDAGVARRLAVINPGFKETMSGPDEKIQLHMPVDETYLQLSAYAMELMSILGDRNTK